MLLHFQLDAIGDFNDQKLLVNFNHFTDQTTVGDDLITFTDAADQLFVLFSPLALWPPDDEVKHQGESNNDENIGRNAANCGCAACRVGCWDKEINHDLVLCKQSPLFSRIRCLLSMCLEIGSGSSARAS